MDALSRIDNSFAEHKKAVEGCLELHRDAIASVGEKLSECLKSDGTIYSCGNGGSACDAMHFAGELVGRFVNDRKALPAMAFTADPGILTAVGNDYGFDHIFARQVQAHGKAGDVLVAISTSGKSPNVLKALDEAKTRQMYRVLLTGEKGKDVANADTVLWVPSHITAHIQECHILLLQLIVALIEDKLFENR